MSILNTDCQVSDMNYALLDEGRYAGRPIVSVVVGEQKPELGTVQSIKALMDRYGWTDRVRSQRTPLAFCGQRRPTGGLPFDPAHERHAEAITTLADVLRPKQIWLRSRGVDRPSDAVTELLDYQQVHLSQTQVRKYRDGERDVWHWYSREARTHQTVDFVIECRTMTAEDAVADFSRHYTVPDDRIFLYPAGETIQEVNDCFYKLVEIAKRNEWRVSPRMSFLDDATAGSTSDADESESGAETE